MKMKNILNSLFPWLAVTTLLSLQGCENEEGTAIHSRDTVSFEIDAGGARATETTFETGDAIGVYAAVRMSSAPATLKTSGNYADNKRFVWNGSQFVADGDANEIAAGYETHSLRSFRRRTGMPTVHSLPFYLPTAQKRTTPLRQRKNSLRGILP